MYFLLFPPASPLTSVDWERARKKEVITKIENGAVTNKTKKREQKERKKERKIEFFQKEAAIWSLLEGAFLRIASDVSFYRMMPPLDISTTAASSSTVDL
jgi:hypothetical protein